MIASLARWTARFATLIITALFITFLVGEGLPDPRELADQEIAQFGALFLMIVGSLVAWRRDLLGALLLLLGFAALEDGLPPLPFAIYPIAAALLLLSAALRWLQRRRSRAADSPPAAGTTTPTVTPGTPPST